MRTITVAVRVLPVALLLAGFLLGTTSGVTLADCPQVSPWPSFSESAPAAYRILIGTVIWTPGGRVNGRFTLRVDEVLRGQAPSTIDFNAFRSGAPQPICPEDSVLVVRHVGDRLAFAYGARLPGLDRPITSVAFVAPSRPFHFLLPHMERLTAQQVRDIASLPPTDLASPTPPTAAPAVPLNMGLGMLIGLMTAAALARRRGAVGLP